MHIAELSHLPNAIHIDRVLVSLKINQPEWLFKMQPEFDTEHEYLLARTIIIRNHSREVWNVAVDAAWRGTSNYTGYAAADAIVALIAYDESAHLLDSTPEEIRLLIALGHPYAVLFLHTSIAFSNIAKLML